MASCCPHCKLWMDFFMALVDSNLFLVPICSSCCHRTALTLMMVLQRQQQQQQHNPFSKSWSHGCVTSLGSDPSEEWSQWNVFHVSLQLPVKYWTCVETSAQTAACLVEALLSWGNSSKTFFSVSGWSFPSVNLHVRGRTSQVQVWQTGKGYRFVYTGNFAINIIPGVPFFTECQGFSTGSMLSCGLFVVIYIYKEAS